jgi:hypothetical protein
MTFGMQGNLRSRDIFEAVNEGHVCVTNFRNPLARLISLYNYFRFEVKLSEEELRTERFRAVALARSVSFEEFVSLSDPNVDVYVRNAYSRQLADSCWTRETTKVFDDGCRFIDEMPWSTGLQELIQRGVGNAARLLATTRSRLRGE